MAHQHQAKLTLRSPVRSVATAASFTSAPRTAQSKGIGPTARNAFSGMAQTRTTALRSIVVVADMTMSRSSRQRPRRRSPAKDVGDADTTIVSARFAPARKP